MKLGRVTVAFLCPLAAGCLEPAPETIILFNDSGEQIIATSGDDVEAVLNGKSAEMPPAGGKLIIETARCKFEYTLPRNSDTFQDDRNHRLGLQMESGGKLYAIAETATTPTRLEEIERSQAGGFPLAPQNRSCR